METDKWLNVLSQSLLITLLKREEICNCVRITEQSAYQPPKQSYTKSHLEQTEITSRSIIAEEQAGFRAGKSTGEQILYVLCEK